MKKHGLFKIISLIILALVLLSWFVPASYYSGSEMVDLGLYRVGLYELFSYPILAVQYFSLTLVFLLAVGAFYSILCETGKYRVLVEKIATKLKGKEIWFLVITAFVLAGLQSVFGYGLLLVLFIPFVCSIIYEMGYNKLTIFLVAFVSVLVGTLGSTLSPTIVDQLKNTIGASVSIYVRLALFVIPFALYTMFLLKSAKKNKADDKNSSDDKFFAEKKGNKKFVWPVIVVLSLLFVLLIMGATQWSSLSVTVFDKMHTAIMGWTIAKKYTVVAYILGNISAFGNWDMTVFTVMLFIASIILKFIYKIKWNDLLEAALDGAVKMLKPALLILLAYVVVIITAYHPFYSTIASWIIGWTKSFNIITSIIVTALGSALNIELIYLSQSSLTYMVQNASDSLTSLSIITQAIYGLTMFVAPTSLMLILGLEYLDIPYTKWIKSSWKFLVELLILVLAIIIIVVLV